MSEKDKKGIRLISGVVILLAAAVGAKVIIGGSARTDESGCIGVPQVSTVVVLDRSERVSEQTTNEIRARALAFIRDSTVENELVSVFTVSDLSQQSLVPLIALCKPPESGNRLIEDVETIERRFREKFEAPLKGALSVRPGDGLKSPIAQALIDISTTRFLRGKKNTLLVFSDMLENTSEYSLYDCTDPASVIPVFRASRRGGIERPTFRNTRVVLHLIPRLGSSAASPDCRDKLWVWFFGDNPGSEAAVEVDYLPGGTPAANSGPQG